MTEEEWFATDDLYAMCRHLGFRPHTRKLRLVLIAAMRRHKIKDRRCVWAIESAVLSGTHPARNAEFADLLREIAGNPFRPVPFSSAWRTDTAVSLARGMYELRDFGAMPILADALQDAGCDNDDILNHCRDAKQTHVRGCWVVDLVLGKT